MIVRKKLIEVALPLEAINKACTKEKSIRHGHPSTLHLWWARRPLAAARAVIFAQMVDDPSSWPERFPTEAEQETERQRLFRILEALVLWENTTNEKVLQAARDEIHASWRRTCAENSDHPRAKELFDPEKLPAFHDPFAGGGALPLEAQRLGLESHASDLNPVAVLINKAMIEIPPKFAGRPPVNPKARADKELFNREWKGAQGLAEDVRYYGQWMRDEAEKRIGHLYPKIEVTAEMAKERPDLKAYVGQKLVVIAWIWARTVKSPNPAFAHIDVPLVASFLLATKPGKEAYVAPVVEENGYRFSVRIGKSEGRQGVALGTTAGKRAAFRCLMSDVPISYDYIRSEGKAGRMKCRLMAVVAEGEKGRVYLAPTVDHEAAARAVTPDWTPDSSLPDNPRDLKTPNYGLVSFSDLFTTRQVFVLSILSEMVDETCEKIRRESVALSSRDDARHARDGGLGANSYAESVCVYLVCVVEKLLESHSTICTWSSATKNELVVSTFRRQALPMTWDFAEANPFADSSGSISKTIEAVARVVEIALPGRGVGRVTQLDAAVQSESNDKIVSTDPPYYDNIGYADLSDYFYVWLRRSLRSIYPDLCTTLSVPKAEELVATPYRHGSRESAEAFFLHGMTRVMQRLAEGAHPSFPVTIYYAYKQVENEDDEGTTSTGWETFLAAVIAAGFSITGTWPVRTERGGRSIGIGANALASSIVLVCRRRPTHAAVATRREFVSALRAELPAALVLLQAGNIAPVDLAQAAIGPGMAVYTRFAKVLDAEGASLSVKGAMKLIDHTLGETLTEQEGDFDVDTRWALSWFEQSGFAEGDYGVAETLSKAKNTSVSGLVEAGILASGRGKVRLLKPSELSTKWDPATDTRLTAWEVVHHLVRALESGGESATATLVTKLGVHAESARELCYRLFAICVDKKRAPEALSYNALVQSWPEILRLAQGGAKPATAQTEMNYDADV